MLGWEFPPAFAGGLGIACYNIVKALSAKADIDLIIPFSEGTTELKNVNISGINRMKPLKSRRVKTQLKGVEIQQIPVALSAYPASSNPNFQKQITSSEAADVRISGDLASVFNSRNLYGDDVHLRTQLFAIATAELSKARTFDVIHAHDWPTFRAALAIKEQSHKPLVLHIHALETDRAGVEARNDIYNLEKLAMEKADRVVAVSAYTREQIVRHYGIDPTKVLFAHNGAEPTGKSSFTKKDSEKWIAFVGRLTFQKGPRMVIETAEKLVKLYPNVKFILAGTGDEMEGLVEEVARRHLGRHFVFAGFLSRDQVKDLLAASDAYFMPSVSEPFGLSVVEAVQQGTPSVISGRSGAAEVLINSLSADFWDVNAFVNYLFALLKYPALGHVVKERSLNDIRSLTWERTSDVLMEHYETLT